MRLLGLGAEVSDRFQACLRSAGWTPDRGHTHPGDGDVWLLGGKGGLRSRPIVDRLCRRHPGICLVVFTPEVSEQEMLAVTRAGAAGYLPQSFPPDQLPTVLLGLRRGELALPRHLTGRLAQALRELPSRQYFTQDGRLVELTPQQAEVFTLLRAGRTTAQIARELHLEPVTVRSHIAAVRRRLGARDRRDLVLPDA